MGGSSGPRGGLCGTGVSPVVPGGAWGFRLSIFVLVAFFVVTLWQRDRIRAHWWAMRLASAPDLEARGYYLACLAGIGERGLGAVRGLANDDRAEIRGLAVYALQSLHDAGVDDLARLLRDKDEGVREAAATALAFMQRPAATEALCRTARSNEEPEACAAAAGLGRVDRPEATQTLCEIARSHRAARVRAQALEALLDLLQSPIAERMPSSQPVAPCDPIGAIVAALDDAATFSGSLALERQRMAVEAFAFKAMATRDRPRTPSNGISMPGPSDHFATPTSLPANAAAGTPTIRTVGDFAAACLTALTGRSMDWRSQPREGIAGKCRAWAASRPATP